MTIFFAKKLSKKGFTLAELLIVVAIIAILVAIAVPIFMGSLEKARLGVHKANARTLKALGVTGILDGIDKESVTSGDVWTIMAVYDFDTETFGELTITKTGTKGTHFGVNDGTWKWNDSEISKVPTNGKLTYQVVVPAQEVTVKSD